MHGMRLRASVFNDESKSLVRAIVVDVLHEVKFGGALGDFGKHWVAVVDLVCTAAHVPNHVSTVGLELDRDDLGNTWLASLKSVDRDGVFQRVVAAVLILRVGTW